MHEAYLHSFRAPELHTIISLHIHRISLPPFIHVTVSYGSPFSPLYFQGSTSSLLHGVSKASYIHTSMSTLLLHAFMILLIKPSIPLHLQNAVGASRPYFPNAFTLLYLTHASTLPEFFTTILPRLHACSAPPESQTSNFRIAKLTERL